MPIRCFASFQKSSRLISSAHKNVQTYQERFVVPANPQQELEYMHEPKPTV
ncbi:hypothetical protein SPOG_04790 [Schizosaccharomyces cryophilus OY26]|uniref:Uncharacterized protein n=1 Tax=Schizosaccharomyces cryophilus (strain OY26 / ATCC MYA-4695 / CBS 11777 / NBRC 106824 / NRRL Y48691) TaxID=653667 RepID=S9VWV0_SCHCR|nr:uncharacterized protein SPOG_04790 [Schizosaccharomyces cryophilus OY26]EPY52133.1 hypothetical protein SPOG_04790 [Schizosaccharomyces cryophilus OY26]